MKFIIPIFLLALVATGFGQSAQVIENAVKTVTPTGSSPVTPAAGVSYGVIDNNGTVILNGKTKALSLGSAAAQHFYSNFSGTAQTPAATTRTYISGSGLSITAGQIQAGTVITWRFNMTKTAAGSATSTFDICFGTAGTTADTARVSFTKPAGTAAGDEGWVTIECVVKTNSATGVVQGEFTMIHNLASTGHMVIPAACVATTSAAFDTTLPTNIGICITSGASDAITISQVSVRALNL